MTKKSHQTEDSFCRPFPELHIKTAMTSLQNPPFSLTAEGRSAFVECDSIGDVAAARTHLLELCDQARELGCDSISVRVANKVVIGPAPICVGDCCADLLGDAINVGQLSDIAVPSS